MKLTKKLEKEVMATYETYWDSYLNGNVAAISSLLDESYSQVGSAETEVFSNKKDAVQFLHDTINQVAGKLAMRNRSTRLEQQGNFLLFHELCDLYALAEPEWIFYSKFRATTIMGEKTDGWKIIHQHSSFPDARTGEGENLAIDKVAEENRQLREAIKRCTVELEHKNRELEIESSLERVRAVAMSMQKAEGLLDVVEILNTELKTLGFTDIRNTIINIFNDTKQKFLNYDYSDYGVGGISEVDYNSHPSNKKFVNKMREASKDFMITKFTGNELDEWRKWRIDQGQMPDSKLDQAESLYYYEFSIGVGSIGISTFRPINADQLKILSKIRNVFSLAYQRYLDIALAEAQAREAQIEASLERVRAVAMSMMRSNDLMEVSKTLLTELNTLGFENIRNTQIDILNDDKGSFLNYEYSDYGVSGITEVFYDSHPHVQQFVRDVHSKSDALSLIIISGSDLDEWRAYRKQANHLPDTKLDEATSLYYYCYSIGTGALGISTFEPISDDKLEVLKRFRNVFDLAYRRYIDITTAEAQAREAQIEAALERVRSKAMAMHKSEDLTPAVATVFSELDRLGFRTVRCGIGIFNAPE